MHHEGKPPAAGYAAGYIAQVLKGIGGGADEFYIYIEMRGRQFLYRMDQ